MLLLPSPPACSPHLLKPCICCCSADFKWNRFCRRLLLWELAFFMLWLLSFFTFTVYFQVGAQ
jgi:hypothetical protein